ncbi:hypothetical protein AMATHDRAFT_73378 [Amanita thiersii Skay4041]|uniref:Cerato-platanin n=1 Tax=Amanita thiersii Skay4041 TaxID=703135 RepID=A0A2A9NZY6_9AGAR|nr:hypothetical protein AMATHDRAFT_73378 [Amanita thiersii Skay4041]
MKFSSAFVVLAGLIVPGALSTSVTYDQTYDNADGQMTSVACSNGMNGIISRYGYTKFSQLPTFPYIGGAAAVTGWNSPKCGSCWQLTFNDGTQKRTINVTAIDYAANGFNIGLKAMDKLTNGNGVQYGVVDVTATELPAKACGL